MMFRKIQSAMRMLLLLLSRLYSLQSLAKHVMKVHLSALQVEEEIEGELSLTLLKKFIGYCKL